MIIRYKSARVPLLVLSLFVMVTMAAGCELLVHTYLDNSGFPDEVKFDAAGGTKIVSTEKDNCTIVAISLGPIGDDYEVQAEQGDDLNLYVEYDWVTAHEIDNHNIEVSVLPNSTGESRKMYMRVRNGNINNGVTIIQSK